jgi:carboxyl-terminal processing protease
MIRTLNRYRIAKHRLLLYLIFLFLALYIVNSLFAGEQEVEDFPWEIFYPAFIKKSIDNDNDKDGFTKVQGDCNDSDDSINPNATEICGDGIDQNCTGADQQCTPESTYASENFNIGLGGFVQYPNISAINGRMRMVGDGTDSLQTTHWNGGANPSNNWYPQPGHSNYFDDFYVSIKTYWDSGESNRIYGLAICLRQDAMGNNEWIRYSITKNGEYVITKFEDGDYEHIVSWKKSFLINIDGQNNELAVQKQGNTFRFFINGHEVENLTIEGFQGGAVGIEASEHVNVSFDDFTLTNPYKGQIVIPSDGYILERNELIYKTMKTTYLWYDQVPQTNYENYESAEDLIEDLRYRDLDKWSYITTEDEYQNLFEEGRYIGLGFGLEPINGDEYAISFVYDNSPCDNAGIMRGDTLLAINGKTIAEIENNNLWDTIDGEDKEGVVVRLTITKSTGSVLDLILEKAWVNINAVLHYGIIQQDNVKIGYLVFNKFIETAESELNTVFSNFKQAGVQELILDLRYNTGGRLWLANYLAGLIAGNVVDGQIFNKLIYNTNYRVWDYEYLFDPAEHALNLNRVMLISTDQTCSASESVINGLRPFINVVTIGDTTCGKPVGMHGYKIFDMHISPIEFEGQNSLSVGDYYDGISPACYADDDLMKPFGDIEEDSLYEALFYLRNGNCSINPLSSLALRKIESIKAKIDPIIFHGFKREVGAF